MAESEGYGPGTYGDRWADVYDDLHAYLAPEEVVDALAALAGDGPALELGIGTGRVALPLARRGVEVHGIDASQAMVAKLREKPGGDAITVTIGDFAEVDAPGGPYALVFVVFNTFFALDSQEAQVRCFRNVAGRLADGGVFVIEAFVPDITRFRGGQAVRAEAVTDDEVRVSAEHHDPLAQRVVSQQIALREDGIGFRPIQIRYAWPSELDLMAQLAGMRLRERWGGWKSEPFTAASGGHVSIYERA